MKKHLTINEQLTSVLSFKASAIIFSIFLMIATFCPAVSGYTTFMVGAACEVFQQQNVTTKCCNCIAINVVIIEYNYHVL